MPRPYTFGFEIETFRNITRYETYLRRLGFSEVYEDPSGPWETQSPPMTMFSERPPLPVIYPSLLLDYRRRSIVERDEGSAGTHHHVTREGWRLDRDLEEIFSLMTYIGSHLPLMQFLMARRARIEGDRIRIQYTYERMRWAQAPVMTIDTGRPYWAVTFNPAGDNKPDTLEIRLCETAPVSCTVALHILVAGYEASIFAKRIPVYYASPIPLKTIRSYVDAVLDARPKPPEWARRYIESFYENHKRPVTIVALLRNKVISREEVEELMRRLRVGCNELPRAGMLGEELRSYLCNES